nr:B3 domain-containing protein At1g49475-like [Lolium perenne]
MIPKAFVKWFGEIPSNIIVGTNTGCNWRMTMRREGNDAFIDQGWTAFTIAHQLKVGQFVTFRKVPSLEYSVVIFDHTCTEVVRIEDFGESSKRRGFFLLREEIRKKSRQTFSGIGKTFTRFIPVDLKEGEGVEKAVTFRIIQIIILLRFP